ncbi:hypothetical protein IF1G_11063 [Cordyceps javanica]|uniref:Rhodopsin domain-containing protein n=1 Tax=Cordyceps javanica TaxID=43265 RepID=A0A545ULG9_9HYPO|nr:hypothetical protein IF1G_11063 [Cordyceps javanica]
MADAEYKNQLVTYSIWALFAVACIAFIVRQWSKFVIKQMGLDDWFMCSCASFVFTLTLFLGLKDSSDPSGSLLSDVAAAKEKVRHVWLYASHLFYIVCLGLCRLSAVLFGSRVKGLPHIESRDLTLVVVCGLWLVASLVIVAVRGNFTQPWETMDGTEFRRWMAVDIGGVTLEVAIFWLALLLIRRHNLSKRTWVCYAYGSIVPVVICRLILLHPGCGNVCDRRSLKAHLSTCACTQISMIAATCTSFSALKPFSLSGTPVGQSYELPRRRGFDDIGNTDTDDQCCLTDAEQISLNTVNSGNAGSRRPSQGERQLTGEDSLNV